MSFTGSTQQDREDFVSEQRFIANRQHAEQWAKRPEVANLRVSVEPKDYLTIAHEKADRRKFTGEPPSAFACLDEPSLEWRTVPTVPEYEVSERGDVRRRSPARGARTGHLLQPYTTNKGYLMVDLYCVGERVRRTVHSLVAEAFIGPRAEGMIVLHGPKGQLENHFSNLRYGTHSDNNADTKAHGTLSCGAEHGALIRCGRYEHPTQEQLLRQAEINTALAARRRPDGTFEDIGTVGSDRRRQP